MGYEVCAIGGYTFITDSYTQSLSPSSSATPLFYTTANTSSSDILNTINTLPDRINQTAFTNENTAINWVQNSGKYVTLLTCSFIYRFNTFPTPRKWFLFITRKWG